MNAKVTLQIEERVATVQLNRPEAMNAIDFDMRHELLTVLDQVARDPAIAAVVLTGTGKAFCSGADLKGAAANPDTSVDLRFLRGRDEACRRYSPSKWCHRLVGRPTVGILVRKHVQDHHGHDYARRQCFQRDNA